MSPQPGTAGTGDDPLAQLVTQELTVNGQTVTRLVGLAFDSADQTDGVLRFDGSGSTNGITDGSAKVLVNGTVHDVAGAEWVDLSGTRHTVDSWEKVINSQFDVSITGTNGPVAPGNTLDVTADVTNSGTDQDTQTVTLDINNGVGQVDSASVSLSGGGSSTQTLSWSVPSGQTKQDYQATVSSADDTASQTVTVISGVPASLVSRWTFDDADTNSGTAVDVVGSNDGTIEGATTGVSGANQTYTTNEAYSFDGTDDYVSCPAPDDDTYSVALWWSPQVDIGGGNNQSGTCIHSKDDSSDGWFFGFFGDGGAIRYGTNNGNITSNKSSWTKDTWYHLVAVQNSNTDARIYVDGSQDSQGDNGYAGFDSVDFIIGAKNQGASRYANARIDDVRLYSKGLSDTEVSNLYNNGRI